MQTGLSKSITFTDCLMSFVLLVVVTTVYWHTPTFDFVNIDDGQFLNEPNISSGLSFGGLYWAFGHFHASYYIPLNWISHMVDFSFFGFNPVGHHIINVILHGTNVLLLFLLLRTATGCRWKSGFVALFFAVHPVHVESVAWVTERKDVLSLLFGLLSFHAYTRYARGKGINSYIFAGVFLALGLLVKPMLVSWPALFLLWDWWPLGRIKATRNLRHLLVEKLPFFVLAAVSALLTYVGHSEGGSIFTLDANSLALRIQNTFASVAIYLKNVFYPGDLAFFYPYPQGKESLLVPSAGVILVLALSIVLAYLHKTRPYLLFGWLWFILTLAPMSGIIQAGWQAMADRFAYVPYIGLYIGIVYLAVDLTHAIPRARSLVAGGALTVATLFGVQAHLQTLYWIDTKTLLGHTISVTSGNYFAHLSMAQLEEAQGRHMDAAFHYGKAVEANPLFVAVRHSKQGAILLSSGRLDEAVGQYERAVILYPDYASAWQNYGVALAMMGRYEEAEEKINKALSLRPGWSTAEDSLNAIRHYRSVKEAPKGSERVNSSVW